MSMNEKQYDHPERFNPERYLGPSPALESPVFGFGRRACLGVHYSTAAIFITASSILSVFDLRAQDKDGKDVQINPAFTGGMSSLTLHRQGFWLSLYPALLLQSCTTLFDARLLKKHFFSLVIIPPVHRCTDVFSPFVLCLVGRVRKVWLSCGVLSHLLSLIVALFFCVPFTYERLYRLAIRNLSPAGSPYAPRNLPNLSKRGHPCCKKVCCKGVYEWG
jgi:Cytochrome P450